MLQSDAVRPGMDSEAVSEHLAACSACQQLRRRLGALEQAWRAIPLPPTVEQAKQAFLERVTPPSAPVVRRARLPWRRPSPYAAAAALILVTLGLAGWLFVRAHPEHATEPPGVVEALVAWNLDLAKSASADERQRLF